MERPGAIVRFWFPRDSAASLVRSGSYTRRRWDDDLKNSEGTTSQNRTSSYQRRLALGTLSVERALLTLSSFQPPLLREPGVLSSP